MPKRELKEDGPYVDPWSEEFFHRDNSCLYIGLVNLEIAQGEISVAYINHNYSRVYNSYCKNSIPGSPGKYLPGLVELRDNLALLAV